MTFDEIIGAEYTDREAADVLADTLDDFETDLQLAVTRLIVGDCRGYL
jgi:hypothetical protein